MKIFNLISAIAIVLPSLAYGETVTTTDGRTITLNDDGTYAIEAGAASKADDHVTLLDPLFRLHVSEYDQKSVRFMPKLTNESESAILGVRFTSSFRDAFGEETFSFSGDMDERIAPGASSTANVFYVFEDNPFISGEAYDKLMPMLSGNTGSVVTTITGLALDGGKVVSFK